MVDKGGSGYRCYGTTSIQIDKTSGTIYASIKGAVGDGDVAQLQGCLSGVYCAGGIGGASEQEATIADSHIEERIACHHPQYIGCTLNSHSPEREVRFDLYTVC
jgi:hypothetical protein